jgi:hypothetical protein
MLVSGEYGEEAPTPTPSAENGVARRWRHEGRKKRSRMANEVVATEAMTIIIVRRYRWQSGSCLASRPRHDPLNKCLGQPGTSVVQCLGRSLVQ